MSVVQRCDSCNKDIEDSFSRLTFDKVDNDGPHMGEFNPGFDICMYCEYIVADFIADLLYKNRGRDAT